MEEQFVPYELAVKLKELGFDEKCLMFWENTILYTTLVNPKEFKRIVADRYTSAPVWEQAFSWFRTKGFDMWVSRSFNCFNVNIVEYNAEEDCSDDVTDGLVFKDFIGYEEARLACLEKLIELCQKQ